MSESWKLGPPEEALNTMSIIPEGGTSKPSSESSEKFPPGIVATKPNSSHAETDAHSQPTALSTTLPSMFAAHEAYLMNLPGAWHATAPGTSPSGATPNNHINGAHPPTPSSGDAEGNHGGSVPGSPAAYSPPFLTQFLQSFLGSPLPLDPIHTVFSPGDLFVPQDLPFTATSQDEGEVGSVGNMEDAASSGPDGLQPQEGAVSSVAPLVSEVNESTQDISSNPQDASINPQHGGPLNVGFSLPAIHAPSFSAFMAGAMAGVQVLPMGATDTPIPLPLPPAGLYGTGGGIALVNGNPEPLPVDNGSPTPLVTLLELFQVLAEGRVRPPKFDAAAFVDTLEQVDITNIPVEDMRCPHCWLPFGTTIEDDPAYASISDPDGPKLLSEHQRNFQEMPFDRSRADNDPVRTSCGHIFGRGCLIESLEKVNTLCPICRTELRSQLKDEESSSV